MALEIVSNALFKSKIKIDQDQINADFNFLLQRLMQRFKNPFQAPLWFPTLQNLKEKKAIKGLENVIYSVIRQKNEAEKGNLLEMLQNAVDEQTGETMSEKQIRDEAMTIFLAGHETSALSMAYSFLLFAQNSDANQKIQTELDQVLQGKPLTFEKTKDLVYLRQAIQESLRLYPPAHILIRRTLAPDQFGEYKIPANTNVIMSVYAMHRHPKYWEKPEVFLPERFENERFKQIPKFAYFPFGGGQRLCIGDQFAMTEMLVVLAVLLQKFSFENDNYQLELDPMVTLHPKKDIILTLRKQ
ncbi:MAG: cytochrome P450 [Bacteroidetes bacterium]|nr:MAG: cytochrome P450 [Bacteroidota bacterium]